VLSGVPAGLDTFAPERMAIWRVARQCTLPGEEIAYGWEFP
jgi:hypothetical protein